MRDPDDVALPAAFASLRVEREVRDDGRYIIYFSWPEEERPAGDQAERSDRSSPARSQPWNVSSGPPDEAPDDGPPDGGPQPAPDERGSRV
jgi:hypothetical protein